jgi:hypothetical protein
MKTFLKKIIIIFGSLSVLLPIVIGILWHRYVNEQDSLYSMNSAGGSGCEPYSLFLNRKDARLEVSWKTTDSCPGFLLLGRSYNDFTNLPYKVLSSAGESPSAHHAVTLTTEDESQYQYFVVVSAGEWYGVKGNPFRFR